MFILYSKIDDFKNVKEFELTDNVSDVSDIELLFKSYIYCFYYHKVITDMPDFDLENFGIYDVPFDKCVFIFKNKREEYFKLNCTSSPPSYSLSSFEPSTGDSNIISDKSKDIYNYFKKNLSLLDWKLYKELTLMNVSKNNASKYDEFGNIVLEENNLNLNANESFNLLQLNPQSSVIESNDIKSDIQYSDDEYEGISINQRKAKLKNLKNDLENAIKLEELNNSYSDINKSIKKFEIAKSFIKDKTDLLNIEKEKLKDFSQIAWFGSNENSQAIKYIKDKKYLNKEEELTKEKVKSIDSKIEDWDYSVILKHKVFMPTIILGIISYLLSWMARSNFWYLSLLAIVLFSVAFYYLWEYADQLKYSLGLRREKRFFIRKLEKTRNGFVRNYSKFERLLNENNVKDIHYLISEYEKQKELKNKIDKLEKDINEFKEINFSSDDEKKLEQLYKEKKDLEFKISKFDILKLTKEEIEYKLARLKSSIKKYEKEEMSSFSLDDDIIEEDEEKNSEKLEYKYKLDVFDFLNKFSTFSNLEFNDFFERIVYKWIDSLELYIHSDFDIILDSKEVVFLSELELKDWNEKYIKIVDFFMKLSISNLFDNILFIDISDLNKELNIDLFSSIKNIKNIQVIYA